MSTRHLLPDRPAIAVVLSVTVSILGVLLARDARGQARNTTQSASDYIETLKPREETSPVRRPIRLSLTDDRYYQDSGISLVQFHQQLKRKLSKRRVEIVDGSHGSGLPVVRVALEIGYLGLYETDGGRWGYRAILDLEFTDRARPSATSTESISVDEIINENVTTAEEQREWEALLVEKAATKTAAAVRTATRRFGGRYREVVAHGVALPEGPSAPRDSSSPSRPDASPRATTEGTPSPLQERAVLDALRRASERAWGIELKSTTTMTDLADVTEETLTRRGGRILQYTVLDQHTRITPDGSCVVLVRAVLTDTS
jgi:hypothetical protein